MRELAEKSGKRGYLVDGPEHLSRDWFSADLTVGLTAGASAPEILVQGVLKQLMAWGGKVVDEVAGRSEHVMFALPRALRDVTKRSTSLSSVDSPG